MQHKIFSNITEFLSQKEKHISNKSVVFTNGCFDILHPGHLAYLEEAKSKGDILIVGLNSDASIKNLKGKNRPINNVHYRSQMLAGLSSTDFIIVFDEETPKHIIEQIAPNFLVKGADYTIDEVVGAEFVQSKGGEVILIPLVGGFSTSKWLDALNKKA